MALLSDLKQRAVPLPALERDAGEDLTGIYSSTDFLVRANVPSEKLPPDQREKPIIGNRVAVIGGGGSGNLTGSSIKYFRMLSAAV